MSLTVIIFIFHKVV